MCIDMINQTNQEQATAVDKSKKSILARGCDPGASAWAAKAFPPMMGNPEYVPTTNDVDFIEKLKARQWSVIYFAPGACRFSAVKRAIPGSNVQTKSWTLEEYRDLVRELQGDSVKIVESLVEEESLALLKATLDTAREVR